MKRIVVVEQKKKINKKESILQNFEENPSVFPRTTKSVVDRSDRAEPAIIAMNEC